MEGEKRHKLKGRLNRVAGQIAGIQRMVDEDTYCVDILTQIAAVRSALDALGVELIASHIESCVVGHGTETEHTRAQPMTQDALITELRTTLARFLR